MVIGQTVSVQFLYGFCMVSVTTYQGFSKAVLVAGSRWLALVGAGWLAGWLPRSDAGADSLALARSRWLAGLLARWLAGSLALARWRCLAGWRWQALALACAGRWWLARWLARWFARSLAGAGWRWLALAGSLARSLARSLLFEHGRQWLAWFLPAVPPIVCGLCVHYLSAFS